MKAQTVSFMMFSLPRDALVWIVDANFNGDGASNARQKFYFTMGDADNGTAIYRNDEPIFHLAFVLLSINRTVSVVYSSVGVLASFPSAVR